MSDGAPPAPPELPETAIVVGTALAAGAALVALAVLGFGASRDDWPGLAGGAAAILFTGLAVLAGAPPGWRWVGATVCAHLGLHPWLAYEATRHPLTALGVAVVALTAWAALGLLQAGNAQALPGALPIGSRRLQPWGGALFLALLVGLSALVRPDLPAVTLPLGALALWLSAGDLRPRPALALFAATAVPAVAVGLAVRWQVFDLDSLWMAGALAPLTDFLRLNAVGATAGLSALAVLGARAWRTAALLYLPLLVFAGLSLWTVPRLDGAQALHLPLLPLLAIAFAVLLARALDAVPPLRPADDLGKVAALILGLIYVSHLLAVDLGSAPPAAATTAA